MNKDSWDTKVNQHTMLVDCGYEESACLIWDNRSEDYAKIRVDKHNRAVKAHRLSYAFHHNLDYKSLDGDVLHHCDVPRCVRPEHLYLGDHSRNMRDKIIRGPRTSNNKLTPEQRIEIYNRYNNGERPAIIAEDYPVGPTAVKNIGNGRRSAYITGADSNTLKRKPGGQPKLTDDERAMIVEKYSTGNYSQRELAVEYNVTQPTIGNIWREFNGQ